MAEGSCEVWTGSLGGGKSLGVSGEVMEHLAIGGEAIGNIPIDRTKVAKWMLDDYGLIMDQSRLTILECASIRDFYKMAKRGTPECPVLMFLDEAALDLNARDYKTLEREVFNFVVLVRKLRIRLVFCAQDANDMDLQIRKKFQLEVHCRSLMRLELLGFELNIPVFVRVYYMLNLGHKAHRKKAVWSWKGTAWGYFDSHALHGAKAAEFAALPMAQSGRLKRREYNPLPYYAAAGVGFAVSSLFTSWLLLA